MTKAAAIALLLGVTLTLAGCGDDGDEEDGTEVCEDYCAAQAAPACANTPATGCLEGCTGLWSYGAGGVCRGEWRAFAACAARTTWFCNEETGYPYITACFAEGDAWAECIAPLP